MQISAEHGANRKTLLHKWCKPDAHWFRPGRVPLQLHGCLRLHVVLEEAVGVLTALEVLQRVAAQLLMVSSH
jgi:hypothetical protein